MTLGKVSRQAELLDDVARFSDEVLPERSTTRSCAVNAISCSPTSVRRPVRGQGASLCSRLVVAVQARPSRSSPRHSP
jgi:hypothetical protein